MAELAATIEAEVRSIEHQAQALAERTAKLRTEFESQPTRKGYKRELDELEKATKRNLKRLSVIQARLTALEA